MPDHTQPAFALARAAAFCLLAGACTTTPAAPDTAYRQAFERAVAAGRCDGAAAERMWNAHHQWFAVGEAIRGLDRTDEAVALVRQGDSFRTLGCPDVARASYTLAMERYPDAAQGAVREAAFLARAALPPPALPPGPALPAGSGPRAAIPAGAGAPTDLAPAADAPVMAPASAGNGMAPPAGPHPPAPTTR